MTSNDLGSSTDKRPTVQTTLAPFVVLGVPSLWILVVAPWTKSQVEPATHLVIGEVVLWGVAAGLIVTAVAGGGLAKLGFRRINGRDVMLGVVASVVIVMLVPGLMALARQIGLPPTSSADRLADLAQLSVATRVLLTLRAGISEELLFRAYPIERWARDGGRVGLGAGVGLVVFCVLHLPSWGLTHTITVVLPLGALFTMLYVWRRNVVLNMVVHILVDTVPLIVLPLVTPVSS